MQHSHHHIGFSEKKKDVPEYHLSTPPAALNIMNWSENNMCGPLTTKAKYYGVMNLKCYCVALMIV